MKQILVVGDLARWQQETEFIIEMLHLSASGVVTMNIGPRPVAADLNSKELRRLFPDTDLAECAGLAAAKLYSQGIADGILCLIGKDPASHQIYNRALAGLPFGLPKVALVAGDSSWKGSKDIIQVHLPGGGHNLNPVIKICLSNTVFAISGMSLCNIHNFGSKKPTIGVSGCGQGALDSLAASGFNYLTFEGEDAYLGTLLKYGYVHGLLIGKAMDADKNSIEIAAAREIPVIIADLSSDQIRTALAELNLPAFALIVAITPEHLDGRVYPFRAAAAKSDDPAPWLKHCLAPHKFGTEPFYRYAARVMTDLLI